MEEGLKLNMEQVPSQSVYFYKNICHRIPKDSDLPEHKAHLGNITPL
jgi:hypothetical protein